MSSVCGVTWVIFFSLAMPQREARQATRRVILPTDAPLGGVRSSFRLPHCNRNPDAFIARNGGFERQSTRVLARSGARLELYAEVANVPLRREATACRLNRDHVQITSVARYFQYPPRIGLDFDVA